MKKLIWTVVFSLFAAGLAIAADATAGKALYDKSCKACHGADGKANPAIAKSMKVEMVNLGDPAVQKLSDADLKSFITNGKGKMKPVKSVQGKAVDDVAAYMRTFNK